MKRLMMAAAIAAVPYATPALAQTQVIDGSGVFTSAIGGLSNVPYALNSPFTFHIAYNLTSTGVGTPVAYSVKSAAPNSYSEPNPMGSVVLTSSNLKFDTGFGDSWSSLSVSLNLAAPLPAVGAINLAPGSTLELGEYRVLLTGTVLSASVSAAPEPGAWLLTIAGIGAIGAGLRRRRSHKCVVTAPCR